MDKRIRSVEAPNRIETAVRKLHREKAPLSEIREHIDYARGFHDDLPGAKAFLDKLEMEYVIKPLGGIALG